MPWWDAFTTGYGAGLETGPGANVRKTVEKVSGMMDELTKTAGKTYFEAMTPESIAKTGYYSSMAGAIGEGGLPEWRDPTNLQVVPTGTPGAIPYWPGRKGAHPTRAVPQPSETDEKTAFLQDFQNKIATGQMTTDQALDIIKADPKYYGLAGNMDVEDFLRGAERTKPPFWKDWFKKKPVATPQTAPQRSTGNIPVAGPQTAGMNFNTPQEADNSGLPKGTIVTVAGRRYQI